MVASAIKITSPVVKFFNPFGAYVWLATELDEDGDIMFGLADIGYPELGSWSLNELRKAGRDALSPSNWGWSLSHVLIVVPAGLADYGMSHEQQIPLDTHAEGQPNGAQFVEAP